MEVQYIRHSTMVFTHSGKKLLVDPVLGPAGSMDPIVLTQNRLRNPLNELPFDKEAILRGVDAVLVSHCHSDHLDPTAIDLLPRETKIFCQPSDLAKLTEQGFKNLEAIQDSTQWNCCRISRFDVDHSHNLVLKMLLGKVSAYLFETNGTRVLYTGDGVFNAKLKKILLAVQPTDIIANAGAAQMVFGKPITLDHLALLEMSRFSRIHAIHMDSFNHCETKTQLKAKLGKSNIHIPLEGETFSFG